MKRRKYGVLIAVGIVFLVLGIGIMGWMLHASRTANRFEAQVEMGFMAAQMLNAHTIHMDESKVVVAEYEGKSVIVHPDHYNALKLLLTQNRAAMLTGEMNKENALRISFCKTSDMFIGPVAEGDGIYVEWLTQGERYYVRIKGNDIWERVRLFAIEGVETSRNIPL